MWNEVFQVGWEWDLLFRKQLFEPIMEILPNELGIWDPVPIIIFDVIYTVLASLDDCGKVEKLSVPLTILKPQFPWFLPPQNLTPGPFCQFCLETSFHYFIVIGALFSLDFFDFAKKCANSVLATPSYSMYEEPFLWLPTSNKALWNQCQRNLGSKRCWLYHNTSSL